MENKIEGKPPSSNNMAATAMLMPPPKKVENGGGELADGLDNPSNVRNLKDLLNFTTKMTADVSVEDSSVNEGGPAYLEEKKEFLKNVLSTMSVNVHEEMNNSINILLDSKKPVEEYDFAFDVIGEYVDSIDYANDFQKIGGYQVFIPGLASVHKVVRCRTAELIATVVQHNSFCQEKFIEHPNYTNLLINVVENDDETEVRIKALSAISSLIRHNVTVFWKFIELGGNKVIVNALKSSIDKLKIKAAFLINSTSNMGNDIAEMYVDNGVVEVLCSIIVSMEKGLPDHHHELFLATLNQLICMSPSRVKDIIISIEDFKVALLSLGDSYPTNDANYQDEKDQILWLIETLTL